MAKATFRANGAHRSKPVPKFKPTAKERKPADPEAASLLSVAKALGQPIYRAELAEWMPAGWLDAKGKKENRFDVHEDLGNHKAGKLIATIFVNPSVATGKAARDIAWLMSSAPDLWRMLLRVTPSLEDDDMNIDFNEASHLLLCAAGRRPFDRRIPDDDQKIYVDQMRAAGFAVSRSLEGRKLEGGAQ